MSTFRPQIIVFLFRDLLPNLPEKPTIYLESIDPLALAPLVEFIYGGEARGAKNLLPAFMEAANILKVNGLIEEEVKQAETKPKPIDNSKEENVLDQQEELQANPTQDKSEDNSDDLGDEIDALMKDVKTFGEEEDSTLDGMETQDDVDQGKAEDEEDVVKVIETVVEKYDKDPETEIENVEEKYGKDSETEGGRYACDLCSFVTAARKRNSRNFAMKRHKIKAHGEKEIMAKSVKVEEDEVVEQKEKLAAQVEIDFDPSQDENMDASEENNDGKDDSGENEINLDENLDEENHTASNQEVSEMEGETIKEEDFGGKLEEERAQTLPCNFCSFVSSAKKGHNRNTALKRHMKVFHPESLAETVHESSKTESKANEFLASALSVEEEEADMDATSDFEEETSNEEIEDESIVTKINDLNSLIDEEGREEEENKENVELSKEESDSTAGGGDEGELVICEEPSIERLPCQQCNFVTSAKSKKDRASGLKRHIRSHHFQPVFTEAATEERPLEDINHVQDDEEKDMSGEEEIKEVASDDLGPSFSENSTLGEEDKKVGESCILCGFASSASKKSDFVSSMKRHMIRKHGGGQVKERYNEENSEIKIEQTSTMMEASTEVEEEDISMEEDDSVEEKNVELTEEEMGDPVASPVEESPPAMACLTCGFASKSLSKANQVLVFHPFVAVKSG